MATATADGAPRDAAFVSSVGLGDASLGESVSPTSANDPEPEPARKSGMITMMVGCPGAAAPGVAVGMASLDIAPSVVAAASAAAASASAPATGTPPVGGRTPLFVASIPTGASPAGKPLPGKPLPGTPSAGKALPGNPLPGKVSRPGPPAFPCGGHGPFAISIGGARMEPGGANWRPRRVAEAEVAQ